MKLRNIFVLFGVIFLVGCSGNIRVSNTDINTSSMIRGKVASLDVIAKNTAHVKTDSFHCFAFSVEADTSAVAESIEQSIRNSFDNRGSHTYDFKISVDQDIKLESKPGAFTVYHESDAELSARVSVIKDGESLYVRSYNVENDHEVSGGFLFPCPANKEAVGGAIKGAIKKLVRRITDDLDREVKYDEKLKMLQAK
jgi:hypothetical protein